jgi:hypothetical protein
MSREGGSEQVEAREVEIRRVRARVWNMIGSLRKIERRLSRVVDQGWWRSIYSFRGMVAMWCCTTLHGMRRQRLTWLE